MIKKIKFLSISILFLFSFFYVTKIREYLENNSKLIKEIDEKKEIYEKNSVDAIIYENTIIPGVSGRKVDVKESYYFMRPLNSFNDYYLVYEEVSPVISLEENKDLYIISGNKSIRAITFIIENNIGVEKFLNEISVPYNKLIKDQTQIQQQKVIYINNGQNNFDLLDKYIEKKICIVNQYNKELCMLNDYYLVKIEKIVTNENYIEFKKNLYSGQIIQISNELSTNNFISIYNEVIFKGYIITYLDNIIKE